MPRPLYETEGQRKREYEVAIKAAETWKCKAQKIPISYHLDYAFMRDDKLCAWAEVKCRTNHVNAYPTYMLSMNKIMHGIQMNTITGAAFVLIVEFTNGIYWVKPEGKYTIGFNGRRDRNDTADMEPVAYIPMNEFKPL